MGWLAGLWRDVLGRAGRRTRGRLLRARRRFAVGGAVGRRAAPALPAGDRRRPLRPSRGWARWPGSSTNSTRRRRRDARGAADTAADAGRQVGLSLPLATLTGLQWVVWLALINNVVAALSPVPWLVTRQLVVDPRRVPASSSPRSGGWASRCCAHGCCCRFSEPGTYRRGGAVHLRVWLAERLADASGAENLAGAPWMVYYARALGNKVGKGVDLHSAPPVTGMLTLGHRRSIEPEVDLTGHWIDGDPFHSERSRSATTRRSARAARSARGADRQGRRGRPGLRSGRRGETRPVLEGLARGEVWQGPASVAGSPPGSRRLCGYWFKG